MASLKHEIEQSRPFASMHEEALLNLMRTADALGRAFHKSTRKWGLSSTQYNVLRILRGAHPQGLTCSLIGSRMITAEPDITRLLTRLKDRGLIEQERDQHDRRLLWTRISADGLTLLAEMDPVIASVPGELLGHFSPQQLKHFIELLELARKPLDESPFSCSGEGVGCEG